MFNRDINIFSRGLGSRSLAFSLKCLKASKRVSTFIPEETVSHSYRHVFANTPGGWKVLTVALSTTSQLSISIIKITSNKSGVHDAQCNEKNGLYFCRANKPTISLLHNKAASKRNYMYTILLELRDQCQHVNNIFTYF